MYYRIKPYAAALFPVFAVLAFYFTVAGINSHYTGAEFHLVVSILDKILFESFGFLGIVSLLLPHRRRKHWIIPLCGIWFFAVMLDCGTLYFQNSRFERLDLLLMRPGNIEEWFGLFSLYSAAVFCLSLYLLPLVLKRFHPPETKIAATYLGISLALWVIDLPWCAVALDVYLRNRQTTPDEVEIKNLRNIGDDLRYLRANSLVRLAVRLAPVIGGELKTANEPPGSLKLPLGQRNYPDLGLSPFTRIVFVSVDSLSLDLLGPYNPLLPGGLQQFYGVPEVAGRMFTGMYSSAAPQLTALSLVFNSHPHPEIFDRAGDYPQSLVGYLRDRGYRTVHMRGTDDLFGVDDRVLSEIGFGEIVSRAEFKKFFPTDAFSGIGLPDRLLFQAAVERLKLAGQQPIFLHLLATDTAPPSGRQSYSGLDYPKMPVILPVPKESEPLYVSVLRHTFDMGLFFEMLRQDGLFDQHTLVVISADRCSPLNQAVKQIPGYPRVSLCRIPFLLLTPQTLPAPIPLDSPCSQVDIAPTLFHLLSLPIPKGWWGQSLFYQEKKNPLVGVFRDSLYLAGPVDMRVPFDRPQGADEQALINLFNSVHP